MTRMGDLLGPDPVLLPSDTAAEAELAAAENPSIVAAAHPSASVAGGALAEEALAEEKAVTAYAYAPTGYPRGRDKLRRNGWKGFGPVPWAHEPNRGFLRCVAALARAAEDIGETEEYYRCLDLLDDCDPAARGQPGLGERSAAVCWAGQLPSGRPQAVGSHIRHSAPPLGWPPS